LVTVFVLVFAGVFAVVACPLLALPLVLLLLAAALAVDGVVAAWAVPIGTARLSAVATHTASTPDLPARERCLSGDIRIVLLPLNLPLVVGLTVLGEPRAARF
jgi:hypothetical protein